jgi:hypothetical protein
MVLSGKIVGKWSIDIMYGPGAQEDTVIIFFQDGTGWIEFSHYVLCELDTFNWKVESNGNISIFGDKCYDSNDVWKKSELSIENIEVQVNNEMTPSKEIMEVITFSKPIWVSENKFGLITRDIKNETLPQF